MSIKIAIGSDHAGFELKDDLINFLKLQKYTVIDKGCYSNERADYPDFGHAVAISVLDEESNFGILLCGSGNGINMAANKHKGIRAALCWNAEIASLARKHNNANILVLPARYISIEEAHKCVTVFLTEAFEGGRHQDRITKIDI
ncbi:ribose 5-phosphate isomerase B [Sediminibacterium sp.]|uniref:ribose 5-phosphate isomerase B n=1 Tax=Sediminibacterium sp. TaxID=1917865 RepID=UPI0027265CF9|nr:ribose 5-phosphate isomerase B [Sediminibacterium sp.]MDO9000513.1 ribose 5-phosphate isomerase B [Bacteroidota bacterium]MDP3146919.1 ribose 5-phosphate isomerase B [Bacteroidota bacterium]MDP3567543.1 ribose 5-phosphate isomerase B [Sediminibacterium sp.]